MKGVRELKRRLKGVQNIRKITKAIELVASTKLRRLQERAAATRPFANQLAGMMKRVAGGADPSASPLLRAHDTVTKVAILVVAGDKGLCGSYNSNVFRTAIPVVRALIAEGKKPHLFIMGRRAGTYFAKVKDVEITWVYPDSVEKIDFAAVKRLAKEFMDGFVTGRFHEVRVVYTSLRTATSFRPLCQGVLPVPKPEASAEAASDYILEPEGQVILDRLLPRFVEMQLFAAILESLAAEFASRRIAMKSATDNAGDMISSLSKEYNKARQSGITAELLEISGGAEAIRGT